MTAKEIIAYMESLRNEEQRRILMGFFKTGPGEYGEDDEFLGLKVPQTREVVKNVWKVFPLREVPELLMSKWHEVRLCGLLILVAKFERLTKRTAARTPLECTEEAKMTRTPLECTEEAIRGRDEILTIYLKYAEQANNWDLVDLSVHKILGHWLLLPTYLGITEPRIHGTTELANNNKAYKIKVLDGLAQSDNLWRQRMSIVCTWKTSQMGDPSWCLRYAEIHLHHPHDLMHKAVGWMLREMGKRCSMELLRDFLRQHAHEMSRTMLRYAIEKMPEQERQYWMAIPQDFAPAKRSKVNRFAGVPVSDFVEMILKGDDEAMYYLLHDRLNLMTSYLNTENIARSKDGVEYHPLQPFLPENAKVLFLGSFPPQRKRWCMDFYYPNFINDHWRIEGQIFFGDKNHFVDLEAKRFKIDEIVSFCEEKGLAFFDTSTAIRRLQDNASDKFLEVVEPTDIPALLRQLPQLRAIVTTGEKATETICKTMGITDVPKVNAYVEITNNLFLYRLPSSSRAYPLSFDKKVEAYRRFFNFVNINPEQL